MLSFLSVRLLAFRCLLCDVFRVLEVSQLNFVWWSCWSGRYFCHSTRFSHTWCFSRVRGVGHHVWSVSTNFAGKQSFIQTPGLPPPGQSNLLQLQSHWSLVQMARGKVSARVVQLQKHCAHRGGKRFRAVSSTFKQWSQQKLPQSWAKCGHLGYLDTYVPMVLPHGLFSRCFMMGAWCAETRVCTARQKVNFSMSPKFLQWLSLFIWFQIEFHFDSRPS